jgi:hypothetical protein
MRSLTLTTILVAAAALAMGAASAAAKTGFFKTSNNRIWCGWGYGGDDPAFVVCGIKNGFLKPKPKNTCKDIDYAGNRIAMNATGKAKIQRCAGDAGPFANPKATKVLAPGRFYWGGGIRCTVTKSTVRCKNKSKHGFMITTPGAYEKF